MTGTDSGEKLRALVLSIAVVFSVFAGSVAFSGGVVGAGNDAGNVALSINAAGNQATVTVDDSDLNTAGNSPQSVVVNVDSDTEKPGIGGVQTASDTADGKTQTATIAAADLVVDRNRDGSITKRDFTLSGASDESITSVVKKSGSYVVTVADAGDATTDDSVETITYTSLTTQSTGSDTGDTSTQTITTQGPVGDLNADGVIDKADVKLTVSAGDESIVSVTRNADGTADVTIADSSGSTDGSPEEIAYLPTETVVATETGDDTGTFVGSVPIAQSNSNGVLHAQDGDSVEAVYWDDGPTRRADSQTLSLTDTTSPSISSVSLTENSGDMAVSFFADEQLGGSASDLTVSVSGPGGATYTFDRTEFTEQSVKGGYTYSLSTTQAYDDGDGTYTAAVVDAYDAAGNNGGINGDGSGLTDSYDFSAGSDTTSPSVSGVTLDASSGDMSISFFADEQLGTSSGDLTVSVTGPNKASYVFDRTMFTEQSVKGGYSYSLSVSQAYDDGDGSYTVSVDDAFDAAGNNGGINGDGSGLTDSYDFSSGSDTMSPSISAVSLDASGGDVTFDFFADEQLGGSASDLTVSITGPNKATYTFDRTDFTEKSTQGGYAYLLSTTQTYDDGDGTYTVSVDDAFDAAGNNGGINGDGSGLTDSHDFSGGSSAPSISSVTLSESGGDMSINFFADEQLGGSASDLTVTVSGPNEASYTFDRTDFTEHSAEGGYGYSLSTAQAYDDGDGSYTVTVADAYDSDGNNGGVNGDGSGLTDSYDYGSGGENSGIPSAPYVELASTELSTTQYTSLFVVLNAKGEVPSVDDIELRFYNATESTSTPVTTVTEVQTIKGNAMIEVPKDALGAKSFTGTVELVDVSTGTPSVLASSSKTIYVYDGTTTSAPSTNLDNTADSGIDVDYQLGNIDPANAELVVSSTTLNSGFTTTTKSLSQKSGTATIDLQASEVNRNFTAQIFVRDTSRSRQIQSSLTQICVGLPDSPCPTVTSTDVKFASDGSSVSGVSVSTEWNWFRDGLDWYLHPAGQPDNKEIDTVSGISSSTKLNVTMTVDNFDPTFVMGTANAEDWHTEEIDDDTTKITYELRPADVYWHDQVDNPDPNEWPLKNASATTHYDAVVDMSTISIPGNFADKVQGGLVATDAQAFAPPRYTAASDGNPGKLKITVAAPHFETDGSTVNSGFYTAIIPSGITTSWGVQPSQLTASFGGQSLPASISLRESGAIKVDTDIHYSSGTVEISGDTSKPVADAGSDTTVSLGSSFTLDASGSSDSDGSISKYEWDVDGDGTYEKTGETVTHSYGSLGMQEVTLRVTDDSDKSSSETITVSVEDTTAPTASTGSDRAVDEGQSVNFDASGSTDNDAVASYAWDFDGDGTTDATGVNPTHSFANPGTYDVTLTVTDGAGNTDDATVTVTVRDVTAPTADAGSDRTVSLSSTPSFDASGSTDNDAVASYAWDFDGDGTTDATGATPSHSFSSTGSYDVTLTVTDDAGNTGTDTVTVTVQDTTAPTADAGSDRTVDRGQSVSFDASGSTDNDAVASYAWDFDGDGTTDATGATPTHSFSSTGSYDVTLTVTDDAGNTATDTMTVTVQSPPAPPSGGPEPTPTPTPEPTPTPTPEPTPTPTPEPTPTSTPTDTPVPDRTDRPSSDTEETATPDAATATPGDATQTPVSTATPTPDSALAATTTSGSGSVSTAAPTTADGARAPTDESTQVPRTVPDGVTTGAEGPGFGALAALLAVVLAALIRRRT